MKELQEKIAAQEQVAAKQAKELEALKKALKKKSANAPTARSSNPKKRRSQANKRAELKENAELMSRIKDIVSNQSWRVVKFVPGNERQEEELFVKVRDAMIKEGLIYPPSDCSEREEIIWKDTWTEENGSFVATVINQHRNYVQSNLKGAAEKYWAQNNESLPTVDEIVACANRSIDLKIEANLKIFAWYWDKLLPQVAGNNQDWTPGIRHYGIISEAAPQDRKKKLYMTPSHEAFAVAHFKSYRDAWTNMWALKKVYPDKQIIHAKNRQKGVEEEEEFSTDENNLYLYAPRFKPKWTSSDTGADRSGGWNQTGKTWYATMLNQVKEARRVPDNIEKERTVLEYIRQSHGLTAQSHDEERRKKRRKQNNDSLVGGSDDEVLGAELQDWDESEEDEDDEDEGNNDGEDDDDDDPENNENADGNGGDGGPAAAAAAGEN